MSDFEHTLRLEHRRHDSHPYADRLDSYARVDVEAGSPDLTEAWRDLLSRLPNDVYGALKAAMPTPAPPDDPDLRRMRCPRCGRESMGRKGDAHVHADDDGAFYLEPLPDDMQVRYGESAR